MGLDSVELICRVEAEFEIQIANEDAEKIATPRQLLDYLISRPEVAGTWSRDSLSILVWLILEDQLGIDRKRFTEDSRFVQDMGVD